MTLGPATTESVVRLPANHAAVFGPQAQLTTAAEFPLLSSLRVLLFSRVQKAV